ncbi:MAG TPA: hypothetical protein VF516_03590 [Kofleriaceae bacterium]
MESPMLRYLSAAALALAICACEPSLPQTTPTPTVTAIFDPTAAQIPLPNDLAFAAPINSVCPPPANALTAPTDPPQCAQAELLKALNPSGVPLAGAFPSDQEVPLTIDFTESTYVNSRVKQVAPDLDLSTITPATLFVIGPAGPIALEPPTPDDYVVPPPVNMVPADHGTLSVHRQGHQPWPPGAYVLVLRGGDQGVKTKATADTPAIPVTPSPVFDLIEQGKDMTAPENLGLLKAQSGGSTADAIAQGQQLNLLIAIYKATAFPAADTVFPHEQLAIASTFHIGPTVTNVEVDPARGLAPLPFDLLRDAGTGKLTPLAACTLAGSSLRKDGTCPSPAAAGFQTLDGFSTTGAILAPTSDLIQASTVTKDTLMLFDLSDPKNPTLVPAGSLIVEPCEFTSSCTGPALAPVIAFQPAGATAVDPTGSPPSVFRTKPLKDSTDYAVVMTTDIKDKAGNAIGPGTVAKILQFKNPLTVGTHSALLGIDDATAASLDKMRKQLAPVFTALGANATKVAMAYTFHTQTVLGHAVDLAALPYSTPTVTAGTGPVTPPPVNPPDPAADDSPRNAFTKFGVIPRTAPADTTPGHVPLADIDEVLETTITTFNALDPATGAFLPDPSKAAPETIKVLIATPKATAAPDCPAALSAFNKCAPLVVFRHGLGRGRADMLLIANAFAAAGMVTVAIDAAKHGDRTLCSSAATPPLSGCAGTCTPLSNAPDPIDPPSQGPPGTCDPTKLIKAPVDKNATGATDGIAVASGNYLISANFFRTRDTLRQDLIDESQLIRVVALDPSKPPMTTLLFERIKSRAMAKFGVTMIVDPTAVYFSGQSLGAIQGAMDVATNPRISRAAFNVGGGTLVDVFATAPAFHAGFTQLISALGITPGTSQFLQFLTVAKTVLDPADPINFVGHLTDKDHMLPNLLPPLGNPNGLVPQQPKAILSQIANCDDTVPNPFNFLYASNAGLSPLPPSGQPGTVQQFVGAGFDPAKPTLCSPTTAIEHGFFTDFANPPVTDKAQADQASFLKTTTPVLSIIKAP